jgi:hypothetical protein
MAQVVDRMMIRPAGVSPSPELWHRDEAKGLEPGEFAFGGWINLDDADQTFIGVPHSHLDAKSESRGFYTISKFLHKDCAERSVRIRVPPGHILIFYENLIHCVASATKKYPSYRQFISWAVTKSEKVIIPGLDSRIEDQAIIPLKSGQLPPIYAKLHLVNWPEKTSAFAKNVKPEYRSKHTFKSGRFAGTTIRVPQRFMKSLREMNHPMYPEYSEYETKILHPQPL